MKTISRIAASVPRRFLLAFAASIASAAAGSPARPGSAMPAGAGSGPLPTTGTTDGSRGLTTRDASGWLRTVTRDGSIDRTNPFFQSLGSNGRSCNSCHQMMDAWSVTPEHLRARFDATDGTDPIFRPNDGANSPLADVSTLDQRRIAYSMLLERGVIRVGIGIPADAEFSLDAVDDPYDYASAAELSLFRRPLPSTNLAFLTGVMWDGRETAVPFLPPMDAGSDMEDLVASLRHQALGAILGHAQGVAPPDELLQQIVDFELGLTTAQIHDDAAGMLNDDDAIGGPRILANQRFHIGINDPLGDDPTGATFDPAAMRLFEAWDDDRAPPDRRAIARGEALFNEKPIEIRDVGGLNDVLGMEVVDGTCTTCHNAPNVGNHTVAMPLNIGLTDADRRTPDMPLYTLHNKTTGDTVQTTDPGLALLTGRWSDIGKFKGPILRGLAGRAPYFHNGSAATLEDVVEFYDTRFSIGLSAGEKSDIVAFLRAL
jgi:cytochrome c peroxidase